MVAKTLSDAVVPDVAPHSLSLVAHSHEYCNENISLSLLTDYQYMATDGKTIFRTVNKGTFDNSKGTFDTPKLNISGFDKCPHFYGSIYWKGRIYEIQHKMTQDFIKDGIVSGGDWEGYKAGDWTQRFLSKASLEEAFDLIKMMME